MINTGETMSSGSFVKMGNKWGTTYPETGDAMFDLIEDFYQSSYSYAKSAGAATYGDNGYFNAIMGKTITAAMFASDNVFTALGAKPYQHEGVRIALELATYGLDASGKFVGLGADTLPDGDIPDSVAMDVGEYRERYKELPYRYDYGLALMALENKDDTIAYNDYMKKMAANYSDLFDKTILRPIDVAQPTKEGMETSLNGIARCISSYGEMSRTDVSLTTNMICPYGGDNGDFTLRGEKKSNLDGKLVDLKGGVLEIDAMSKLWRQCSVNWTDSANPNGKVWCMGNIAQDLLAAKFRANNILLDQVYTQRDFNGVKTIPGRGAGILLNAFNNIPIIQDGNINFNYTDKGVSDVKLGDIFLLDLDHIWISVLTPVEVFSVNNPAITLKLQERNVMNMRAEVRTDSYIQSGRIVGAADIE